MLTAAQRAAYERDGFLVLESMFDAGEVSAMAAEADRLADHLIKASLALAEVSPRLDIRERPDGAVNRRLSRAGRREIPLNGAATGVLTR